jgi:2',3'-cyclic-nucleotide 2'-phosphodiesterase (5'-nucleotidase family)
LINPTTGSPVFGLYMPDAIASFSASGQTYYVTANEGDDRNDFLNPDETTTVSNAAYDLDNTVFPNEAALKNQASLGRLTVSNAPGLRGDTDNDGDIDEILSYGGRSFSILDSTGAIVFDSGDMIENIIASQFTANFDDGRSDNKGPEPEGVTIATLGARTYAFVGLERSHMALVFDVTNPAAVTFTGGLARAGDLNPEGLVVVSSSDSPSGKPLLLVASEVSQTLTVFELNQTTDYTLQVLHYYGESGLLGIQTAPIMGAMIDRFDDQYANTLVLAEGDSFIPGPWLIAGADPSLNAIAGIGSTALGRPDFAIMNAFGTDASALGNHEFDLGSPVLSGAFFPAAPWVGAQFPFITTNLNFAADSSLRGRADTTLGGTGGAIAGSETTAIKAKIAPYAVQTISGQKVGIVGSTTWDLLTKTSPNGTVPKDDANPATSDLQEVAAYLQGAITALQGLGVNKIILVDQLDTLQRNKDLAGLVSGIDIMVAGGGHERMGDANDVAVGFNGHDADFIADAYPIVTSAADGKPTLIVTTDTEFSYLGRLVVDFDSDGVLILPNLNTVINGAYASTEANLQAAYATASSASTIIAGSTIGTAVQNITNALNNIVVAKDSSVFGYTDVYLEGDRVFGRTQEVNQGNITADANAWKARTALGLGATDAVFSLKNGGGIRASLGSVLPDGTKVAPLANPITGKPAKGISQLDIENALRFDNKLMVFDTTPTGLLAILNFAAGLSGGPTVQSGGYPQVGNIRFSYNSALPTGQKVRSAAMVNEAGQITARIVENGAVLPGAPATIQCVSINFTANGGDGYPIKANADNFRYLLNDGSLSAPISEALDFTAAINVPANVLGEQKAFSDFLVARHPSLVTAYKVAETPVAQDTRIQQLAFRSDNVLNDPRVTNVTPAIGSISGGTSVTITGTNFTDATTVTFGGTNATSFTVDSATQITTTTPAHLAGAVSVLVTNPNGTNPANTLYTYAPPEIAVHNGSHSLATELSDGQVTAVDFGSTAPNTASVRSFLVRNTSAVDLKISSITVPSGYATTGAAATLAAGTSYGFQVSLDSATPATYTGNVVINNDDLDESAFDFPVTGTVVAAGSAPVVNLGENIAVQGSTGSAVLGGPAGSTLSKLIGSPAINSSGVLASAVQIRHANASIHTGMMSGQPLTLIATDTQTAVGMAVGVTYSIFNPPVINEAGHIAFTGEVRGPGITKGVNNRCLFSNASDGVLKLAAQIGMSTTLGSNLKTIGNFAIGGDLVIFLGTLVDNRVVLFGWDASTGLRPLVRTGQTLSTNGVMKTVKSFSILETGNASSGHGKEISVAPSGESLVTFSVIFTDNTQAVVVGSFDGTSDTGFGLTYGASQQLADTYAAPGVIPLAKWSSFRSPGFDNTGNYYGFISQMVTNTLAGVSSTNNVGVFVDTAPGVLTMQLRESNAAPGITAGVVFSDFSDLVLGGGDYEFLVKGEVRGSGVVTNVNDKGLWAQHATSGLMLVAREGSEAPGVSGSTFLRLTQIALPGTAQPIFEATMKTGTGGVTTANDTGLWVVNEAGEVKLAVREGDVINVGGTNRTVTAITALLSGLPTGGALGRRAFLEDGQITLLLTFSGGIQANAKVVVP